MNVPATTIAPGVEIGAPILREFASIVTPEAITFVAFLQPPTDPLSGTRFSANSETALLTAALVRADHRVIVHRIDW